MVEPRSRARPAPPGIARRLANVRAVASLTDAVARAHGAPGGCTRIDVGPYPVAYVRDVDAVRSVLDGRHPGVAERGRFFEDIARVIGPSSLVTCEGATHRRLRRAVAPAFRPEQVAHYASTMLEATDAATSHWRDGERLDLGRALSSLTLEIAARALVGLDGAEQAEDFVAVLEAGASVFYRLALPRNLADRLWRSRLSPANRRLGSAQARIDDLVARVLAQRRAAVGSPDAPDGGSSRSDRPPNLLDVLLAVRGEGGEPLSDAELRDQVVTFLFAGHETTAQALTWLFVQLTRHRDVAERVAGEVDDATRGRAPAASDLAGLRYTRATVRETLRLFPPAWFTSREASADTEIAGCPVPKGSLVVVSPLALHRDPLCWSDPDRFDPERFLDDDAIPAAYLPFGHGRRNCIGANFALVEAVAVVAGIVARWRVHVLDATGVRPRGSVTLRPRRPVLALLERRG